MPEAPDISRVTSRAEAEDLIGSVLSGMRELEAALGAETAQVRVGRTVEENRIVLATARAVSEGLIKSLSEEITRASRPMTYGPATGSGRSEPSAAPLVVSRSL